MIKVDMKPEAFSLKYNIELIQDNCRKCGLLMDINIPMITKDFVAFESEVHECGAGYRITILKPRGELAKEMEELL